jgi:hypothetical protein
LREPDERKTDTEGEKERTMMGLLEKKQRDQREASRRRRRRNTTKRKNRKLKRWEI